MSPAFRYSFASAAPVCSIAPGEALTVSLPDSDGLGADLQPLPDSQFEGGSPDRGNPVYGPVAVHGAKPGDALRIHFERIQPNRSVARTLSAPGHGFLPDAVLPIVGEKPRHLYLWDIADGRARVANPLGERPVEIPVRPFLGCVATASAYDPAVSSLLATNHGGNIDHSDLVEGTTLWLPVSRDGGLLYLGDMHAAQGHGETAGGGLEISGAATVRVDLCREMPLSAPRYQTPEGAACLAVEKDLPGATRAALAAMIRWLVEMRWNIHDASMLVSQSCEFRMGGLNDKFAVVSCFVRKDRVAGDLFAGA